MAIGIGSAVAAASNLIRERFASDNPMSQMLYRSDVFRMLKTRGNSMEHLIDKVHHKIVFTNRIAQVGGFGKPVYSTGALPSARVAASGDIPKFTLSMAEYWVRLLVSHDLLRAASASVEGARGLAREVTDQVDIALAAAEDALSSAFLTDGYGTMTLATAAGTGTASTSSAATLPVQDVANLHVGQYFDILNTSGTEVAGNLRVTGKSVKYGAGSISFVTSTSTFDASTVAANYKLVIENSSETYNNSTSVSPHGLEEIVDDGTTHAYYPTSGEGGLQRTAVANKDWTAEVIDATATGYTGMSAFNLLNLLMTRLAFSANNITKSEKSVKGQIDKTVKFLCGDPNVAGLFYLDAQNRLMLTNMPVADFGPAVLHVNGFPYIPVSKISQKAFALDLSHFWFAEDPLDWVSGTDGEGNLFTREVGTKNYEAAAAMWVQIHCDKIRTSGKVVKIDTTLFDPSAPAVS